MLKCYIVDDEIHAIELLTKYINKTPGVEVSGSTQNPITGLLAVQMKAPDILFLDINMPNIAGDEFATLVKGKTNVVFTTGSVSHAINAFENEIADYLLKPVSYDRFLLCVNRLKTRVPFNLSDKRVEGRNKEFFFIQCGVKSKMVLIRFDGIAYIESLKNYIIIHHENEKHISYLTLKEIQEFLPERFLRVHKSYLINIKYISSIEGNQLFISGRNPKVIPLGSTFKEAFMAEINKMTLKRKLN